MKKQYCHLTGKQLVQKTNIEKSWGSVWELSYNKDNDDHNIYIASKTYDNLDETFMQNYGWLIPSAQFHKKISLNNRIIYKPELEKIADGNNYISLEELKDKIADIGPYPRTQKEKFDNSFLALLNYQKYDGEEIHLGEFSKVYPYEALYLKNWDERNFYFSSFMKKGLISGHSTGPQGIPLIFRLTFEGLIYGIELQKNSTASTQCFVAMSFAADMKETREAIKDACRITGFQAMLIDEAHYDSAQTINDAMIAEIKKSRFCISDFTHQRQNVYFEAGYALGLGIPVIYTCHANDMSSRHFDTRHFPHISYKSPEQLKRELINKIEAWITTY